MELVVALDLQSMADSIFESPLLWEGENGRILPVYGDAAKMPLPGNYFDLAVSSLMIDDCPDQYGVIKDLFRVTKPGSVIMIAGHGIDLEGPLKDIPDLLGHSHLNQCTPEECDHILVDFPGKMMAAEKGEHTWLRIVRNLG